MAKDAKTAGSEFLAEVLGKLPAELQAQAKAVFEKAEAGGAIETLGGGALRQSDYSTLANTIKTKEAEAEAWKKELDDWFATKKADLAELDTLRAGKREPVKEPVDPAKPDLTGLVTKADFDKILRETEQGAVGFIAEANVLALKHYKDFGEVLSITDLLADKRVQQIGLSGVYADKFKTQIDAKTTAEQAKRDEALREEGRKAERERLQSSQHPYLVKGNEVSTLDLIEAAKPGQAPVVKSVEDMAAEYDRISGVRAAG